MRYRSHFDAVRQIVWSATSDDDAEARVVAYLHDRFDHHDWVGIYRLDPRDECMLVLGPWRGGQPTEHTRIPVGQGICGSCAASCRTEIVPDVGADARYLACFRETRSEIVVPIIRDGRFYGEIDIDSSTRAAFGPDDVEFLESVARLLAERN